MDFNFLEEDIYFIPLQNISKEKRMFYLTEILFYKNPRFIHYHYDMENNETSLLISNDVITPEFLSFFNFNDIQFYNCIQITNTNEFLNESGFVKKISSIFSQKNIPILYITTLKSNFILFLNIHLSSIKNIFHEF